MRRGLLALLPWLLLAATPAEVVHADADGLAAWLQREHRAQARAATWRSPTAPERAALARGVSLLAAGADRCDDALLATVAEALAPAGVVLSVQRLDDARIVVLREQDPHGVGLVAVRCGEALPLVVQAPHAFFDVHTGALARAAFAHAPVRAATWNTVHRYRALPGERPEDPVHPADVTHQTAAALHTITLALAAGDPRLRVVQLHGFGDGPDRGDVIVSSGRADRPPRFARAPVAEALGAPPDRVRVYGDDARDLGGTTNVQARQLAWTSPPRFLHLELSRPLRDRLAGEPARLAALARALGERPWDL